jgi:hypothetical protein
LGWSKNCKQHCLCLWIVNSWSPLRFSPTFICPVSCVSNVASFLLWIVNSWSPFRFSLTFICLVSCVSNVASVSKLSILVAPSGFSNVYLSCVLCVQYCQCLWIVHFGSPFGFLQRLFVLCLVCPMLPVSLNWLFLVAPLVFSNVYLSCVLCVQCRQYLCSPPRFSPTFICPVSCVSNVASIFELTIFVHPFCFL